MEGGGKGKQRQNRLLSTMEMVLKEDWFSKDKQNSLQQKSRLSCNHVQRFCLTSHTWKYNNLIPNFDNFITLLCRLMVLPIRKSHAVAEKNQQIRVANWVVSGWARSRHTGLGHVRLDWRLLQFSEWLVRDLIITCKKSSSATVMHCEWAEF